MPAFTRLLDRIVDLGDLDAAWLRIVTDLLRFVAENMPAASSWTGLDPNEPDARILRTSGAAREALNAFATNAPEEGKLSFATKQEREVLRSVALKELAHAPFDEAMNVAATALGLAEAIDGLTGHTFMPWFKGEDELVIEVGTVYPIREPDPGRWLGDHLPSTRRSKLPTRLLLYTGRLQVATSAFTGYRFVLDFRYWDILSELGGSGELIAAVGQPNADLDEFDVQLDHTPPSTYANHGPKNHEPQARLVHDMIDTSGKAKAEILVLPEYGLASASQKLVENTLPSIGKTPRLVVSGVSSGTDSGGYIINDAVMIISANGKSRTINVSRKIHPAQITGFTERVRRSSDVRLLLTDQWTIATIICFDGMATDIIDQLATLGVNLLFVPSLSPRTAAMVSIATSLCTRSQAFVVMATGPARWESKALGIASPPDLRWEAVFGGPYAVGGPTEAARSASTATSTYPRRNLWTFDYGARQLNGYAVP
ncbi:hypothetical protein BST11_22680 [Mycobacterium alsense]|nr:hypothetical protein BST11_22680 [Mycobacterium alsense]